MRECKGMTFFPFGKSVFDTTKMSHSAQANPQYSCDKLYNPTYIYI